MTALKQMPMVGLPELKSVAIEVFVNYKLCKITISLKDFVVFMHAYDF